MEHLHYVFDTISPHIHPKLYLDLQMIIYDTQRTEITFKENCCVGDIRDIRDKYNGQKGNEFVE